MSTATLNVSDHVDSDLLTLWFDVDGKHIEVDLTPMQALNLGRSLTELAVVVA